MDWKWMIERGGRVTFTVISAPTHTHTHTSTPPRLPPNTQTNPMTLKVSTVPGVFGADRIGPISLNLRYLARKETHLAAINSTFFVFLSLCIPSPAVILYVWLSEGVVPSPVPWIWWKRHWREHLLTAHPRVCGRRTRVTQNISLKFQNEAHVENIDACSISS